ncbi:MAG TPA: hypothetical protein PLH57_03895 [Oligoflexia bacterium]|mgnify:CR=1 FL=1|nr:hypothetical protein [Oligoflexia bacterium]
MLQFFTSIQRIALILGIFQITLTSSVQGAPIQQGEVEVLQAKAAILFHSKKESECLKVIDSILEADNTNKNALELRALVFKSQNKNDLAAETYLKLIEITPPEKAAPYHFELGAIRFKQKQLDEAKKHFTASARRGFNKGTSHFFAGMADTSQKNWTSASKNFAASLLYPDAEPMRPVSRFYLATAHAQAGKSTAAIRNYVRTAFDVSESSKKTPGVSQHGDLKKNAVDALKSFNQEQYFVTGTYLQQWDNNVTLMPYTVTTGQQATGKRTLKSIVSVVAGYSSSPTKKFQFVPSNTVYTNYNYNYKSREMNFFSDTPSFYLFYKPYNRFSTGIKAEGTYNMKRQLSTADGSYKYRPYSMTGDFGPLLRYEALPSLNLGYEISYKPKRYYRESKEGEDRRSGRGLYTRFTTEFNSEIEWLTPNVALTFEWDDTLGTSYRSRSYGMNITNPISFTDELTVTPGFDLLSTDYYRAVPTRTELLFTVKSSGQYSLGSNLNLLADISFTRNNSTQSATFTYTRLVASTGLSYSF